MSYPSSYWILGALTQILLGGVIRQFIMAKDSWLAFWQITHPDQIRLSLPCISVELTPAHWAWFCMRALFGICSSHELWSFFWYFHYTGRLAVLGNPQGLTYRWIRLRVPVQWPPWPFLLFNRRIFVSLSVRSYFITGSVKVMICWIRLTRQRRRH